MNVFHQKISSMIHNTTCSTYYFPKPTCNNTTILRSIYGFLNCLRTHVFVRYSYVLRWCVSLEEIIEGTYRKLALLVGLARERRDRLAACLGIQTVLKRRDSTELYTYGYGITVRLNSNLLHYQTPRGQMIFTQKD